IERAVDNLTNTLVIEFLLVAFICTIFLLHVRSALVAILMLPVGVLLAFIAMRYQGINANIMSLGGIAIAIGAMVDGPIVLVENAPKHLARARESLGRALTDSERWAAIGAAAREVGPPLFFSLLVIVVSYLAIFTLEAQEGRLFKPLAFTSSYSMLAAAILAVTVAPLLTGYFVRGRVRSEQENPLARVLHSVHAPALGVLLRWPKVTLAAVAILLAATWWPLSKLGSEFMPPLDEGDILYMPTTFPGISITKAKELLQQTDKILRSFPQVETVFGKVGRAETATDAAPLSMVETIVQLKPRDQWPDPSMTTRDLMREMDAEIKFPGLANAWTMPIKTRIDMLSTGIKTPVGIKVSGPDLSVLQQISEDVETAMKEMPGTLSAFGDRAVGGYFLDLDIKREEVARYGLTVGDVQDVIMSAIGGMSISETVEGLERYPINLRYPRELRDDPVRLGRVLVPTPGGAQIPIEQLADIRLTRGAPVIKSEDARPNAWIYVDLKGSDVGGFVARAKKVIADKVELPAGYTLSWSGQYEYMERAAARLRVVIPLTLFLIFVLLYFNFNNFIAPVVVMMSVPFALVGGFWIVYWYGFNMSVAVAVGFIALAGVAIETGVLVLTFVDEALDERRRQKAAESGQQAVALSWAEVTKAVHDGTSRRVRPVAMTASSTIFGLLPIMFSSGTGSDVMQRIAAPMVGGMLTTTLLCLMVVPVIYGLLVGWMESRRG
ncbi:MAG TPA: efflux RND transporter permease subunit, partial [Chromatiales bacterium]|nr:efflux RND transporter permease subunit [Chromatiales bacterium]